MPTNLETGITPLPDGGEVHWAREEAARETARRVAPRLSLRLGGRAGRKCEGATRRGNRQRRDVGADGLTHAAGLGLTKGGNGQCGCGSLSSSWSYCA